MAFAHILVVYVFGSAKTLRQDTIVTEYFNRRISSKTF